MNLSIPQRTAHRMAGLSLIELLVAMALGLILTAGMVSVLAGNQRSSEVNTSMAILQENARFILDTLGQDIRMSGFQGCLDINSGPLDVLASGVTMNFRSSASTGATIAADGSWSPEHPFGFEAPAATPAIAGTHALVLQFGGASLSQLNVAMTAAGNPSPAAAIVVAGNMAIETNDLAIVADCDVANLFRVTGVAHSANTTTVQHAATGNTSGALSKAFGAPGKEGQTSISRFQSNTYYVADTGLVNGTGDPVRALYQQSFPYDDVNNPPVRLIEGVENLRVSFGVRDGDDLRYVTPDHVAFDPVRVESIQLGLLLSSFERVAEQDDTRSYTLAGQRITASAGSNTGVNHPGDKRMRVAFNTTIKLRNRRVEGS